MIPLLVGLWLLSLFRVSDAAPVLVGETAVLGTPAPGLANLLIAQPITVPSEGTWRTLTFYVQTPAGSFRLGLYDATGPGGGPGALVAATAPTVAVGGWNTVPVPATFVTAGSYWLAVLCDTAALTARTEATSAVTYASVPFGPLPLVFPPATASPGHLSLYGTLDVLPPGAPTAPVILMLTMPPTLVLTWQDTATNETSVRIERQTAGGPFVEVGSVGANIITYQDAPLVSQTAYCYRVRARNTTGDSPYSNVACATAP